MMGVGNSSDNLLEIKEFFRNTVIDVKGKLNSAIVNSPKFEEQFFKELAYFYSKTQNINFDVVVADDKNSVSITSYSPVVDCVNPLFRGKNKAFVRSVFSLSGDNLVCDFSQGVLFERKLIEESGVRVELDYEAKLETNYSVRYFDVDGIEYSDNSFSDVYPFTDEVEDVDLRERTLSSFHKPIFNEFQLPSIPIHVMKGMARNTYRKKGSFAVIHSNVGVATREGYKEVSSSLYACHPSIPEMLRGGEMFAKTTGNDFKFEILNNYAPDMKQAYDKARNDLRKHLNDSNLKEYSKRTFDSLINNL